MNGKTVGKTLLTGLAGLTFFAGQAHADGIEIIRQSLLGAGVGAISAEASGGKAGKGALIGAGTQVIGTALIGLLTGPTQSQPSYRQTYAAPQTVAQPVYSQPVYTQPAYQQPTITYYQQPVQVQTVQQVRYQPVYTTTYDVQPAYYTQPAPAPRRSYRRSYDPQESNRQILRSGLLGAGVGAISAEASGGKAGTGALVGAGSNVIGGALIELLSS